MRDGHVITGIKFVDELDPFQIWTDVSSLKISDPHEVFLRKQDGVERVGLKRGVKFQLGEGTRTLDESLLMQSSR
jgi:hypothetical protein